MARLLTPKDCHTLMNSIVRQATGQTTLTVTDTSSFVSAGETVLATGMENVMNAINIVLGRLIVASRPYKAKFNLLDVTDGGIYTNRLRKISYYAQDALPSGAYNTDLYTNLAQGYTASDNGGASTKSQWEQHQAMPLEFNFAGQSVWDDCITMYEVQVQTAFRSEEEFARFVAGYLQEHANDIESQHEAFNRMTLLNRIGMSYDMTASGDITLGAINMTKAFNDFYGITPAYTTAQLLSTYLKEFLAFFVATLKEHMDYLTDRGTYYHHPMTKTVSGVQYSILRHTPKDRQRLYMYAPLFRMSEALVLPEIFHDDYLKISQYEPVTYWQSKDGGADINIVPAIYDTTTGEQVAGSAVETKVIAVLYDVDAVMTQFILDRSATTALEARKMYRNVWNHYNKNAINDPTENCIVFYMEDPTP